MGQMANWEKIKLNPCHLNLNVKNQPKVILLKYIGSLYLMRNMAT